MIFRKLVQWIKYTLHEPSNLFLEWSQLNPTAKHEHETKFIIGDANHFVLKYKFQRKKIAVPTTKYCQQAMYDSYQPIAS
jgi:hypothetical protein